MAIVESFDSKTNFWKVNPQLLAAGPFKTIHDSDKTPGKAFSSRLAWSIALCFDPKSKYYNLPEEDRVQLIFKETFEDETYPKKNTQKFEELREFYRKLNETPAQRALRGVEDKLMERDKFIKETPYTLGDRGDRGFIYGTADDIDKMMGNTVKIWELYEKARKLVSDEQQQGTALGGSQQSLTDTGDI